MRKHLTLSLIVAVIFVSASTKTFSQNVGIGTTIPDSKLHVAAAKVDSVAFKVSTDGESKLKVNANGGTSIGSGNIAPNNGLAVAGVFQPGDSIKTATKPIYITSVNDSIVLESGTTKIILMAGGGVKILAGGPGGITINAGTGDVNITGQNVNIKSTANTIVEGTTTTVKATGTLNANGNAVKIGAPNANYKAAARELDHVFIDGSSGVIATGSSTVFIQ